MTDRDEIVIYHNSRCSKSRQALALLEQRGIEPRIVDYLRNPPSAAELTSILEMLALEPRQLMRSGEPDYAVAGLDDPDLGRDALIDAMVRYPGVIQRPIVIAGGRAVIGRPPEKVLEIL
jgi:arsenate reductase